MRILTVVQDLGPGGIQRVAQNFSRGFYDAGHEVAVLAYDAGGPRMRPLQEAGIEVFLGGSDPQQAEDALQHAVRWNPDLVHIHRDGQADIRTAARSVPNR